MEIHLKRIQNAASNYSPFPITQQPSAALTAKEIYVLFVCVLLMVRKWGKYMGSLFFHFRQPADFEMYVSDVSLREVPTIIHKQ